MSIYLDNAATSHPKPPQVYAAVLDVMQNIGASPGRGGYGLALEASRLLFETREALASFFGAADSSRIIFTHNATESLNLAVRGTLQSGDHVITSSMEHNSLLRPLFMLQKQGVELTVVPANVEGLLDPEDVRRALRPSTRLVALAHVSNVTGGIQPVAEIAAIASKAGALLLLDAAQSAGCLPIDMQALGIDLLAAPGHKGLLGPQGTGLLAVAPHVRLCPLLAGGTGSSSDQDLQPEGFPEGFEAGTHNLPGIAGLKAGVAFLAATGVETVGEREREHGNYLRERLAQLPGCCLYGPDNPEKRVGLLSLTMAGCDPAALSFMLDREYGIAVRAGLHCAPRAHRTIGSYPQGTLRISPGWFTTNVELDLCCTALATIIQKGSP
ncbi:MAG: aminotransferase class V-fold PLP-dependent enzyme [Trichlorobacter sp.]|jgi:cysteine desulfurase family protein